MTGLPEDIGFQSSEIKFSEYYENGQLAQTGFLLDGKNHGVWQSYDINGIKKSKGVFLKGKKSRTPLAAALGLPDPSRARFRALFDFLISLTTKTRTSLERG